MVAKHEDVFSGAFLLVVSVIIFITSFSFEALTTSLVGPAFMPQIIAIIMAIFSVIITVSGFKKSKSATEKTTTPEEVKEEELQEELIVTEKKSYKPVLISLALMIGYVALLSYVGFLIMTIVYIFLQMLLLSHITHRKVWLFLLISVVTSAAIYYLFRNVFYVMLPTGIIG
ncbi:tripartite tricarboxylate transporter TctB family protein [Planococcus sp. CPCC 101016]|uniref:tripartite tricarboxylate transporter TctB family protein n=1 Tax=Planococcus sp. CPCC 101016 TaxID=2599617 RepID=UPI0011B378C2|nr:tripartite tricarboxylate transporter TctB family protein [Planococcus sp. CPCC 101016]TWT06519.1 tripartite tricarboxylate transporter TctB family protein [Planococcus sp. CPCC 101016]